MTNHCTMLNQCSMPKQCPMANQCSILNQCSTPNQCTVANQCILPNQCTMPNQCNMLNRSEKATARCVDSNVIRRGKFWLLTSSLVHSLVRALDCFYFACLWNHPLVCLIIRFACSHVSYLAPTSNSLFHPSYFYKLTCIALLRQILRLRIWDVASDSLFF